jgi:hypothetical protein
MQIITIDLRKNPEIADFLADKQPGDEVYLCGSIKSLDDQSAQITITEVEDRTGEEKDKEPDPDDEAGTMEGDDVRPAGAYQPPVDSTGMGGM